MLSFEFEELPWILGLNCDYPIIQKDNYQSNNDGYIFYMY